MLVGAYREDTVASLKARHRLASDNLHTVL